MLYTRPSPRLLRLPLPDSPPRLSLMTSPQCLASGSLVSPPIMDTPASTDLDTTGSASASTAGLELELATMETMETMASMASTASTTEPTPDTEDTMEDTDNPTMAR